MHRRLWFAPVSAAMALGAMLGLTPAADAADAIGANGHGAERVVFVQTNNLTGNRIVAYDRSDDGSLSFAKGYATGGRGGALDGAVSDKLASQGSLTYDRRHALLFAVNAGSDSLSVFAVDGDELELRQVLPSAGTFPVGVAVHDNLVYVLNARDGGKVTGFRIVNGKLDRIHGSGRGLGLDPTATPEFVNTPGQLGFTPDGSKLIVTTKANGNDIDVFLVGDDGRLSAHPVVNTQPGTVPFAFTFDAASRLVLTQAGPSALATYAIKANGTLRLVSSRSDGQAAACWVVADQGRFYVSNTGTSNVSIFRVGAAGNVSLVGTAVPTDTGTIDAAVTTNGRFLYVQTGVNGIVDAFVVRSNGTLQAIGSTTVPNGVGFEGIVAA